MRCAKRGSVEKRLIRCVAVGNLIRAEGIRIIQKDIEDSTMEDIGHKSRWYTRSGSNRSKQDRPTSTELQGNGFYENSGDKDCADEEGDTQGSSGNVRRIYLRTLNEWK